MLNFPPVPLIFRCFNLVFDIFIYYSSLYNNFSLLFTFAASMVFMVIVCDFKYFSRAFYLFFFSLVETKSSSFKNGIFSAVMIKAMSLIRVSVFDESFRWRIKFLIFYLYLTSIFPLTLLRFKNNTFSIFSEIFMTCL